MWNRGIHAGLGVVCADCNMLLRGTVRELFGETDKAVPFYGVSHLA